jgi:N-acetylglucosamine kinase-like BadF-type ATPase
MGLSSHSQSSILRLMPNSDVLVVDLGQSGCRIKQGDRLIATERGKLAGESPEDSLRSIFSELTGMRANLVALSLTGLNGAVHDTGQYPHICKEFFGAMTVALIDDGFASYMGALKGRDGVALTIGGGVVSIGGLKGKFAHRDGLGSTFGDEGGGFWLGKNGITKALAVNQGRGDDSEMAHYFKEEIDQYYKLSMVDGAEAQTFAIRTAKKVLQAADAGISTATAIVDEGAFLLAQTVVATWYGSGGSKADSPEIVIQGGPARNASYSTKIALEINAKLPNAVIVQSAGDNLDGATWIAQNMPEDAPPLLMWAR